MEFLFAGILDLAFVRGMIVGFALAAPVGPVAVMCIRRAMTCGFFKSVVTGLGAALADMTFGAVAGLGLTVISTFVLDNELIIGLVGGALVVTLGLVTYRAPVVITNGAVVVKSLHRDFAAAFMMAITNPATMIAAVGVFAAFGGVDVYQEPVTALWLVVGVFLGSTLWWVILAGAVTVLRRPLVNSGMPWLNKISGSIIAVSGAVLFVLTLLRLVKPA